LPADVAVAITALLSVATGSMARANIEMMVLVIFGLRISEYLNRVEYHDGENVWRPGKCKCIGHANR
jgi:hypothetical protein